MNFDYVLTHAGCTDGTVSAFTSWLYHKKNCYSQPKVQYISYNFSSLEKLDLLEMNVLVLDLSLSLEDLDKLKVRCKTITILDHHPGTLLLLDSLSESKNTEITTNQLQKSTSDESKCETSLKKYQKDNVKIFYDENECGATLTWNFLFPTEELPIFYNYIRDYDLWKHEIEDTKAFIVRMPKRNEKLEKIIEDPDYFKRILDEGRVILEYQQKLISQYTNMGSIIESNGRKSYLINSISFSSEISDYIFSKEEKVHLVCCYYHNKEGNIKFSVRSREDNIINAKNFSEMFGGGGHNNASGFFIKESEIDKVKEKLLEIL